VARVSGSFEARFVQSFSGVHRVDCSPGVRVIEAGKGHPWDCTVYLLGEKDLERTYDYVELLGGRATLKPEWFKVFLHPAKRACREYNLTYFPLTQATKSDDGESGKALECE